MLRQTIIRFAILSATCAVLAWAGVGYLVWDTWQGIAARADQTTSSRSSLAQQSNDAHLHALAASTASDRTQLGELFQTDIVSIVNIIETAGSSAHATTQITDASQPQTPKGVGDASAHAIVFSTQSIGSFASLMHAAELFETLPIPSSVEQIDLMHAGENDNPTNWHMNARIRVLTTSNISS